MSALEAKPEFYPNAECVQVSYGCIPTCVGSHKVRTACGSDPDLPSALLGAAFVVSVLLV